jgi:PAS domain S-box-containing protein
LSTPSTEEAVILINAAGQYIDANAAALDMLGVTLAELLVSSPERFAITPADEGDRAALRSEWEREGSRSLVGTAGLKRADGEMIRVSYVIETLDQGFRARMSPVNGSPGSPSTVFTVGQVLSEWRAAERNLEQLVPNTPAWARTLSEIDLLRSRYQEVFRSLSGTDRSGSA